jgi:hypothetical protein
MEEIKKEVFEFLQSSDERKVIIVNSTLRRDIRCLKIEFPSCYYTLLGYGKSLKLTLSKTPLKIAFNDFSQNTRRRFIEFSGLKIEICKLDYFDYFSKLIEPYSNIKNYLQWFLKGIEMTSSEKDFCNKIYIIEKAISNAIMKNEHYKNWKDYPMPERKKLRFHQSRVYERKEEKSNADIYTHLVTFVI